jgi:LysM repeat protein
MRSRFLLMTTFVAVLAAPAPALANFAHTVSQGESLSSVAAADGLSVSELAAANGISAGSQLVAGTTLQIPPAGEATTSATPSEGSSTDSTASAEPVASSSASGGYVVEPGDTLSSIAAAHGLSVSELAAANGLSPEGLLLAGSTLQFSGEGGSAAGSSEVADSTPAPTSASESGPGAVPTAERVTPSYVGQVAAEDGVSPSLAEAIGDQESGFNNDLVSNTGATGVMQIEPGTWREIGGGLAPDSAADNVRGGVLLLRSLLNASGGDPALAAAGYYQGLSSVRAHGMYSDTQRYVNDVMALRSQFGGG